VTISTPGAAPASDTTEPLDSAHSHWELWSMWRRGPDLVAHIARVLKARASDDFRIEVRVRGDIERFTDADDFASKVTGQALKQFQAILIEGADDDLRGRVSFVRRPTEVPVGEHCARLHRVRHGVVLEVTSSREDRGDDTREAKQALAAALERGRPRWITRRSRAGHAARGEPRPGDPPERGASASRLLEEELRTWPKPSGFPLIFVGLTLLLYAATVAVLDKDWIDGLHLTLGDEGVVPLVIGIGAVLAVVAFFVQPWLFAAVEVATQTNARRFGRLAISTVSLSSITGALTKLRPLQDAAEWLF
jgi:hypothetical protein